LSEGGKQLNFTKRMSASNVELQNLTKDTPSSTNVGVVEEVFTDGDGGANGGVVDGKSSVYGAIFNFVNSIIGAGIIGLPFAIRDCGLVMGVLLLVFTAWATHFSVGLLVNVGEQYHQFNYPSLAQSVLGKRGKTAVTVAMFTMGFGAMCAYMIIVGDSITRVAGGAPEDPNNPSVLSNRRFVIFVVSVLTMLPVSLFRQMSRLAWTSLVSILADLILVVCIVFYSSNAAKDSFVYDKDGVLVHGITSDIDPFAFSFARSRIFQGVGAMSFAFVCHHSTFIVYNSMKDRTEKSWNTVSWASIVLSLAACMTLGLAGYLAFFGWSQADVLNNFGYSAEIDFARVLLAITMVLTYPMEAFVARQAIHSLLFGSEARITPRKHIVITVILFLLSLTVALVTDDLGFVLEFSGALSSSFIGYIFPPIMFMRAPAWPNQSWAKRTLTRIVLVFGVVSFVAGTTSSVANLFSEECKSVPISNPPPGSPREQLYFTDCTVRK
jgi:solute carrier family 38 (sodium-coupled neutral amino acid transporter), member 11